MRGLPIWMLCIIIQTFIFRFNIANFNPHQLHPQQQQQQQQIPQQINLQQQQQQQQGLSINNTTNHFAVAQSPASSAAGGPVSPSQQVPNQPHQLPSYASTRQQVCGGGGRRQSVPNSSLDWLLLLYARYPADLCWSCDFVPNPIALLLLYMTGI